MKNNEEAIEYFIGKKVVQANLQKLTMTLDDGTILNIKGNKSWCICGEGDYTITALNTCDNIIMNAKVETERDEYWRNDGNVSLFVYMDGIATPTEIIRAEGSDNGYYGTGFWVSVKGSEQE